MSDRETFEIKENGVRVATVEGPYPEVLFEAQRYGIAYAQDGGEVTIKRITRKPRAPKP